MPTRENKMKSLNHPGKFQVSIYLTASERFTSRCHRHGKHLDPRPSWGNVHISSQSPGENGEGRRFG